MIMVVMIMFLLFSERSIANSVPFVLVPARAWASLRMRKGRKKGAGCKGPRAGVPTRTEGAE